MLTACTTDSRPAPRPDQVAPTQEARLAPECPPAPDRRRGTSADELNRLVGAADLPAWQAADVGASARLSDGRIVWLFGDTLRDPGLQPRLVANSMLVSSGRCVSQLRPPGDGPVVPDVDERTVHWPMSVMVAPADDRDVLVVLCARIRRGDGGSFDFTFLGTTAAVFDVEPGEAPAFVRLRRITPSSPDPRQVNWGAAAVRSGRWYYVYGTRLTGRELELGRELRVARVPVADPGTRGGWRFWDGAGWHPDVRRAAAVLAAAGGVSQTLSVDEVGGRFVAVSKRDGDLSDFVYRWTAPDPWGPWSPHPELAAPAGLDTGHLQYMPLAHPEVRLISGRLLVTISRNTTSIDQLIEHPEIALPLFAEVDR